MSTPRIHGGLGYSPVPSRPLDPTPWVEKACIWEYGDRFASARQCESANFNPRPEYEQDVRYYDDATRKYA